MDLFEELKRVDLVRYVESQCSARARRVGKDFFVNPCPLPGCGHDDCFSINPEKGLFKCFSCGCGGSIVDFEMRHQGISDPLTAAKAVGRKSGIDLDKPVAMKRQDPGRSKEAIAQDETVIAIEVLEGYQPIPTNIRAFLNDKRGWLDSIIEDYQIGWNSKLGRVTIPVFDGQGRLVNVRQYKPGATENKMISFGRGYGQARLFPMQLFERMKEADRILLSEGEADCLCALSHGLMAVTGTGGAGTWKKEWTENFKGLNILIAFDSDSAGQTGAEKVSQALLESGAPSSVQVLLWPDFVGKGQDLTDWFVTHGKSADELLALPRREIAQEVQKPKRKRRDEGPVREVPPDQDESLYEFDSFQVLGEHEDNRIFFASRDVGKIHAVALRDLTLERLVQIGGEEVRFRVLRRMEELGPELKNGNPFRKIHFNDLRKQIILKARQHQLGVPKWIGQGCHVLADDRLLIVNGREVLIWDDSSFSVFDGAMIEGKLIHRSAGRVWFQVGKLVELVEGMDKAQAKKVIERFVEIVSQWGFAGGFDLALMCGFLLAQVVQDIFDWRPMLWLCGQHGSGKSLLLKFAEEAGGPLSRRFEGSLTSEAGFRQSLKADLNCVSIDEFEKSGARDLIMSILRSSGRGGQGAKGSPSQESVEFSLRHMVCVASIESGILEAADAVRFIAISTKKDPLRDPHLLGVREMDDFRLKFLAVAIWAGLKARRMVRGLKRISGYDPRLVEAHAVLVSMITVADENPQGSLENLLEKVLIDREQSGGSVIEEDENRLLNDIFASTLRVDVSTDDGHVLYSDRSMSWLAQSPSDVHKRDLETCGIKEVDGGVFLACGLISRRLLKDTAWKSLNISSIIQRIPGALRTKKRIDGRPLWGVFFTNKQEILGLAGGSARGDRDLLFT